MARTIPAAITAALQSPIQLPSVSCILRDVFDRPCSTLTAAFAGRSDIIQLPSGSYLRAYVSQPALGSNATVQSQLVTDPTNGTQLGTYGTNSTTAAGQAGVALALYGSTIFLFYQRLADLHICYQTSTDGLTWSAEAVALNTTTNVWALASAGNNDLFIAQDATGVNDVSQNIVYATFSAGSFAVAATWTNPAVRIQGMSAVYAGGSYRLVLGAQSRAGGAGCLCSLTFSGSAWSPVVAIHAIDDPLTGLTAPYPGLTTTGGMFRVSSVLSDSGAASGVAGQRCEMWTSPDFVHWRLEQIISTTATFGLVPAPGPIARGGWLLCAAGITILSTAAAGATAPAIDLSDSLLNLVIDEPAGAKSTATLVLDNHDGGHSPAIPPAGALRVGAQVQTSLGYAGVTVLTHTLYVDSIRQANAEVRRGWDTAEILASDPVGSPSGQLDDIAVTIMQLSNSARHMESQAHVERIHTGAATAFIASDVAIAAGVTQQAPSVPSTPQFTQTVDAFAVSTAGAFLASFSRIASLYGFDWFVDENEVLQLREPQAGDAISYAYGTGVVQPIGHEITPARQINYVKVAGKGAPGFNSPFADAVDTAAVASAGEILHKRVADRMLTTSAQIQIRAGLELRKEQRQAISGTVRLPLNPAHQPLDVISITTETLAATVRITSLRWIVDLRSGAFEQVAEIQAP